jgi:prepilin-type N-terminal cleavage/methylation domain-containing protein
MNAAAYKNKALRPPMRGFSLIELAIVIGIVAIMAAVGMLSFGNSAEDRDAAMVNMAQSTLQSVVAQGSTRKDVTPATLRDNHAAEILKALKASFNTTSTSSANIQFTTTGNQVLMTIPGMPRTATYDISDTGNVTVIGISNNFTKHTLQGGVLR